MEGSSRNPATMTGLLGPTGTDTAGVAARRGARSCRRRVRALSTGHGGRVRASGVVGRLVIDRGVDTARAHNAHVHARDVTRFLLQRAQHGALTPLRRRVRAHLRNGDGAEQRVHPDEHPRPLATHDRQDRPAQMQRAVHRGLDDLEEHVGGHDLHRAVARDGRAMHNDVDPAVPVQGSRNEPVARDRVGDVAADDVDITDTCGVARLLNGL